MQRSHGQGCWAAQEGPRVKMCLHWAFIGLVLGTPIKSPSLGELSEDVSTKTSRDSI